METYDEAYKDLVGRRFGKLVVLSLKPRQRNSRGSLLPTAKGYPEPLKYYCKCDCGNERLVYRNSLISGHANSCGCVRNGGRPKGRKNYEFAKALKLDVKTFNCHGCKAKSVPCNLMRRRCCWDCDDYEDCEISCIQNPAKCGNYGGK